MKKFLVEVIEFLKGIGIMATTVAVLIGVLWCIGRISGQREGTPDVAMDRYSGLREGPGAAPSVSGPKQPDTTPPPPIAFWAEDWFPYIRKHRDVASEFFAVSADEDGIVWISLEACNRLKELTGGLPEEFFLGKMDENGVYWKFDFAQDKYVRYEE